ncbi:Triosephosphate isomerase [Canariomyces notabilis]|uniref:Triosephosphate isomerase n=1 Tax=Canariomyces notabilis TaxID=2074819 RepID=A0AAN6TAE4_9PEZI|nr:Triosephosphate isomerase [Canariomyces arenarius]
MYFSLARTQSFVTSTISLLSQSSSPSSQSAQSRSGGAGQLQQLVEKITAFILPDFISLTHVANTISAALPPINQLLVVGAQNCAAHHAFGPLTGEVSPAVLREAGCRIVMVGHAERRRLFGEGDPDGRVVRDKVAGVLRNGMVPLICVGEVGRPEPESDGAEGGDGDAGVRAAVEEVVGQVQAALRGLSEEVLNGQLKGDSGEEDKGEIILAYEPVWAIGAPEPAAAEYVRAVVRRVRESEVLKGWPGRVRIVYGGAAKPGMWGRLGGDLDGLFLGRFAHQPEQFVKIIHEVAGVDSSVGGG